MDAKLENIYKQIPQSTCPSRCGKCCGPVFPSLSELRNVKDWCALHRKEYIDFLTINENGDCPYLNKEKRCSIYPVRPFLCRVLGVTSPLPCPLNMNTPSRILNRPQSDYLYKQIYLKGKDKPRTEKHRKIIRELIRGGGSQQQ